MVSGGGVGSACPIAPYTDVLVWISPVWPLLPCPPLTATRPEVNWLDDFPVKMLLALTPLNETLLLVSRWPLAHMLWFPTPALVTAVFHRSALTPALRVARCGKLPVPT